MQPNSEPKRFTTRKRNITFYIDDDLFYGVQAIAAEVAMDLIDIVKDLKTAPNKQKLEIIKELFKQFMTDESYERFTQRMRDKENPIDMPTLFDVSTWLFGEAYGLRPTQSRSESSMASETSASGQSSTDGATALASTPQPLHGIDSLISPTTSP